MRAVVWSAAVCEAEGLAVRVSIRLCSAVSTEERQEVHMLTVPMMLIPPRHGGGVCLKEVRAFLCCLPICTALTLSWGLLEQ